MGLGTVRPFGLENLLIGFTIQNLFLLDKKCSCMERTKQKMCVYNVFVPYGDGYPTITRKKG